MDFSDVNENAVVVDIIHPGTKEPMGLRITVLPESDDAVKKQQRKNLNGQLNSRKTKLNASKIEENAFSLIVAAVGGWEWYGEDAGYNGVELEFTKENVEMLLREKPWVKKQVSEQFDATEDFFEA